MKISYANYLMILLVLNYPNLLLALPLNDTGITRCGNAQGTSNNLDCPTANAPGQDAESGRDFTDNDNSDGKAGFSFTKLDNNGSPLSATAATWACVKDNVTGLIWEVKTDNSGLRDKDNTYTWYSTNSSTNGGDSGTQNGGTCNGSGCDTQSYVQAVNANNLCGAIDWRLPTREELRSIVDYGAFFPSIDTSYFPNTNTVEFWSASVAANSSSAAWSVVFGGGNDVIDLKNNSRAVRLVRGRE